MNARDERPAGAKPLHLNLIGGRRVPAADDRTIDVLCPSDGKPFASIARGGAADVDPPCRRRAPRSTARGGALTRDGARPAARAARQLIAAHADELGALEARDTGKPLTQARADIVARARYFEFYAGAADKLHGETIPYLTATRSRVCASRTA